MNQKNDRPKLVVNPFVIYIGFGLLAVLFQALVPLPFVSPPAAHIAGIGLVLLNFAFGLPALRGMAKARTSPNPGRPTSALLSSGVYRFTRNPMYVGLALLYAGLMTYFRLTWGLLFLPFVIWLITIWVIRPEEQYLEQKFGSEYSHYRELVRRWI